MGVTTWTEAQDAILINGLKTDMTYRQLADELGLSKAMVSGRIHRLRKIRPGDLPPKISSLPASQTAHHHASSYNNRLNRMRKGDGDKPDPLPRSVKKKHAFSQLNWNTPSILVERPTNLPVPFIKLEKGRCSWCVDDVHRDASAHMLCCAAEVIDTSKREGDRRSSHCAYHYHMSIRNS